MTNFCVNDCVNEFSSVNDNVLKQNLLLFNKFSQLTEQRPHQNLCVKVGEANLYLNFDHLFVTILKTLSGILIPLHQVIYFILKLLQLYIRNFSLAQVTVNNVVINRVKYTFFSRSMNEFCFKIVDVQLGGKNLKEFVERNLITTDFCLNCDDSIDNVSQKIS